MRKSSCCGAILHVHSVRRKRCSACGRTITIRSKKRGRKKKRARIALAESVIKDHTSLRRLAEKRKQGRETTRRRFAESVLLWQNKHPLPPLPQGQIILIVDAIWFFLGEDRNPFTCYVILIRTIDQQRAIVARMMLLPGSETKSSWEQTISTLPADILKNVVAIVADGHTGLIKLAREKDWHFQWCHTHIKRKLAELRGLRNIPGKDVRQNAVILVNHFLDTEDEDEAWWCLQKIRELFALPECPQTLPTRLSGIIKRYWLFRTYREVSEYNLPVTTNSVERINQEIRSYFSQIHGTSTKQSLSRWLSIVHHSFPIIAARGYKETFLLRNKKRKRKP